MKPVVAGATHRNGEHYKNVARESELAQLPASTTINMYYIGEVLEEHAGAEVAKEVLDDLPPRSSDVIQVAPDNEVDALDDLPLRASDVIQVAAPDNDEVPSRAITQQCQQQQQRQPKAQEPEAKPPRKGHHEQWQRHSASSSTGNGTVPSRAMATAQGQQQQWQLGVRVQELEVKLLRKSHHEQWQRHSAITSNGNANVDSASSSNGNTASSSTGNADGASTSNGNGGITAEEPSGAPAAATSTGGPLPAAAAAATAAATSTGEWPFGWLDSVNLDLAQQCHQDKITLATWLRLKESWSEGIGGIWENELVLPNTCYQAHLRSSALKGRRLAIGLSSHSPSKRTKTESIKGLGSHCWIRGILPWMILPGHPTLLGRTLSRSLAIISD